VIYLQDKEYQNYYDLLIEELKKNGATDSDLNLINEDMVKNAMKNKRTPADLAWAILQ
jgi:hypothetical protein